MATTSNYGWTTPDDSQPVSLGAAAIRSLGTAIDATVYANAQAAVGTAALPLGTATPSDGDLLTFSSGVWDAAAPAGYSYAGTTYFTSSGTFAKADPLGTGDIGLRAIRVRAVGGGGGGGGGRVTTAFQVSVSSGGNSGAYSESFITDIAGLAATVTVTLGAGGSGNLATDGSAGGQSSFGTVVTAPGGSQGFSRADAPPMGRMPNSDPANYTEGTGDVVFKTAPSQSGYGLSLTEPNSTLSGAGASSPFGAGGNGRRGDDTPGGDGSGYGAGGGGASCLASNATGTTGGSGSNGIVIVDCYV